MLTVWLWMTGMRRVDASAAGIFTVFLPVSAALVGLFVFDEPVTPVQVAAYGLALAGVVLATFPGRQRAPGVWIAPPT